ncbi:hypothetical protein JCM6882_001967 [Rhodosporidiobolus microsporus]
MLSSLFVSALAAASTVQAAPFFSKSGVQKRAVEPIEKTRDNVVQDVQIHESCNAAQTHFLKNGLEEMKTIAKHAHDRILELGESDEQYIKYFGNVSSATTSGFYAQLLYSSKPGVLLRCDNPDGNCALTTAEGTWAGHWRGNNATSETVICDRTYTARRLLGNLCWDGAEIGNGSLSQWLATDLMHRLTHVPAVTYDHVHHAANTYPAILALAASNSTDAGSNQNTFQAYAIDMYARDVAYPPNGCVGAHAHEETAAGDSHGAATSSSASSTATATSAAAAATTSAASAEECHVHSDGSLHCTGGDDHDDDDHSESAAASSTASSDCHSHADGSIHCI